MTTTNKIFVTGAGGTVGVALTRALLDAGVSPRLGFRRAEQVARAKAEGLDAVRVDLDDADTLAPALAGVDRVFLLATGVRGQVEAETRVVEAATRAGVGTVVKLSVWQADREAYALARLHRSVERVIEGSGLRHTFLRPNGFMQNFVLHMREGTAEAPSTSPPPRRASATSTCATSRPSLRAFSPPMNITGARTSSRAPRR